MDIKLTLVILRDNQALRVGDGQGSLACCSPWGRKESDMTEQLNWTELIPGEQEVLDCIIYFHTKVLHSWKLFPTHKLLWLPLKFNNY